MNSTPKTGGDCFDANGRHFWSLHNSNYRLVHGTVINQIDNKPMSHCWIEKTIRFNNQTFQVCIDKSNGNDIEVPKEFYYKIGKVDKENVVTYDMNEFNNKLVEFGHWGPWEIQCDR